MFSEFRYGEKFQIGETEYEVLRKRGEDLEVLNLSDDSKELLPLNDLLNAYNETRNRRLIFKSRDEGEKEIPNHLDDYSKEEIDIMEKRYKVIEPYIKGDIKPSGVKNHLDNYPETDRPKGALSQASFYRWVLLYKRRCNKFDLIPKRTGPKSSRLHEDVLMEASRVIFKYNSKIEYITVKDQYDVYTACLEDLNITREKRLEPMSESTFRRLYKRDSDSTKRDKEILGTNLADLKHNGVRDYIRATRPLEVMEADWTPVDCLIVDFDLDEAFRPVILYGEDQATGEPMGYHIIYKETPNAGDWKQLLLHCILPKSYIKEKYPKVRKEWSAYGIPQEIVLDNAAVNDSAEVAEVCNALGIGLRFASVKAGHHKGQVEHALGNLNHKAFQGLLGSLFSNVNEKGEYDAEARATIDIKNLHHIVHIALVDMVANNFNRGANKKRVPEHLWKAGIREMKVHPRLPQNPQYLHLLFSTSSETRKIQPKGIELKGHLFFSQELNELRKRLEKQGKSRLVLVRYGSDMRTIYVRDEENKCYVEAYIKNAGLERKKIDIDFPIHSELLEYLTNKDGHNYNEFDNTHLGAARLAIEEIQEDCKQEYKGIKKRRRREEAKQQTIVSAAIGVPSEQIPGITESINIQNIKDSKGTKSRESSKLENTKDDMIKGPKPGELFVDDIDLEFYAAQWGSGQKELG
ncbi:Mu transposase C-terminal domain-containing protein [Paenibacillus sp. Dod16]|uniref:Mu transposase C-terminal domain-containing protein n=1 Tax=Paenibacillus sp. Dod16 TaxID=3416392 RepID=UPI003CF669F6